MEEEICILILFEHRIDYSGENTAYIKLGTIWGFEHPPCVWACGWEVVHKIYCYRSGNYYNHREPDQEEMGWKIWDHIMEENGS